MSILVERFPRATIRVPLAIQHEFNLFTVDGRLFATTGGHSNNLKDTYSENVDNARAVAHAVNTYDARDEAMREAAKVLWRFANSASDNDAARTAMKIDAALAVKS